jgi:sulfhydrogenase subunit alpha
MGELNLNYITKIEGHASLYLEIENNQVLKCNLKSVEGARFFEGIVKGKHYSDVSEIVSRICGICSTAHTVTSIKAIENALKVEVSLQTKLLRELITIGERIRSHAAHLYFLALPDYLGYESAVAMAPKYRAEVNTALELIKLGNNIVSTIGGREMHPVTLAIGGFTNIPDKKELDELLRRLKDAKASAARTAELFLRLNYPNFERKTEYISLKQLDGFPLLEGTIISDKGLNIEQKDYKKYFSEYINSYSTAKFAVKENKEYSTGALARLNNNYKLLSRNAEQLLKKERKNIPDYNPFHNNIAQAIELVHWVDHAIEILEKNTFKNEPLTEVKSKKGGNGIAVTEAPRGMLFHEYDIDSSGKVKKCNIITPTCQNLANIEKDLIEYVPNLLGKKEEQLKLDIEKLIRSYDPCFSCSTHFLKLKIKRR